MCAGWGTTSVGGRIGGCRWGLLHRNSCGCITCWQCYLSWQEVRHSNYRRQFVFGALTNDSINLLYSYWVDETFFFNIFAGYLMEMALERFHSNFIVSLPDYRWVLRRIPWIGLLSWDKNTKNSLKCIFCWNLFLKFWGCVDILWCLYCYLFNKL